MVTEKKVRWGYYQKKIKNMATMARLIRPKGLGRGWPVKKGLAFVGRSKRKAAIQNGNKFWLREEFRSEKGTRTSKHKVRVRKGPQGGAQLLVGSRSNGGILTWEV